MNRVSVKQIRVFCGPEPDNWFWAWVPAGSVILDTKCAEMWFSDAEILAFAAWLSAVAPANSEEYRSDEGNWELWDWNAAGTEKECVRVLTNRVIGGLPVYSPVGDGMYWSEVSYDNPVLALNILKGYCREIPRMKVRDIDWWISSFGAEGLGDFYSGLKKENDVAGVKLLDELLLALVK